MTWANLHRKLTHFGIILIIGVTIVGVATPTGAQTGQTHTVQAGENLFRIALRYGVTVETLAAANGITDPARIYAGQVLVIPDPAAGQTVAAAVEPALEITAFRQGRRTATADPSSRGKTAASARQRGTSSRKQ